MQLLPFEKKTNFAIEIPVSVSSEEIEMFPSADGVLDIMIPNYLTGVIYGCLVEAYASENNARMTAMQSSTDSAKKMLQDLSIQYNRARQAAITQEITEVCSGAKPRRRKRDNESRMKKGKIVQVMGPVVDVDLKMAIFRISKMPLKSKITERNASWKLLSIWEMMWYAALCWQPVKDFREIWK